MGAERSLRVVATVKQDCLLTLLVSIEEVRQARVKVRAEGQTEAGEYLSLKALTDAEEHLLELILQPAMAVILGEVAMELGRVAVSPSQQGRI